LLNLSTRAFQHNFFGFDPEENKALLYDGGRGLFSSTTIENTARAVVNSLLLPPNETANRRLFIQDLVTSQVDIVATIEKVSGEKWTVEIVDSHRVIHDSEKKLEEGPDVFATLRLIEVGVLTGKYGANLPEEGPLANDALGLQPVNLEDVVKDALASLKT
jgi:hypothetical protein